MIIYMSTFKLCDLLAMCCSLIRKYRNFSLQIPLIILKLKFAPNPQKISI